MPYFENLREHIPSNLDYTRVVLLASTYRFASVGSVPSTHVQICLEAATQLPTPVPIRPYRGIGSHLNLLSLGELG